jgi:hypothetical protein
MMVLGSSAVRFFPEDKVHGLLSRGGICTVDHSELGSETSKLLHVRKCLKDQAAKPGRRQCVSSRRVSGWVMYAHELHAVSPHVSAWRARLQ